MHEKHGLESTRARLLFPTAESPWVTDDDIKHALQGEPRQRAATGCGRRKDDSRSHTISRMRDMAGVDRDGAPTTS